MKVNPKLTSNLSCPNMNLKKSKRVFVSASLVLVIAAFSIISITSNAFGGTISKQSYYDIYVQFDYPDYVVRGNDFSISSYVENKASYDRSNMTITLEPQIGITAKNENSFALDKLFAGGSFGKTMDFQVLPNSTTGTLCKCPFFAF